MSTEPTPAQIRRWQRYLANERAEAAVYWELARRREGEERTILLQLAESETRHEQYWRTKLGSSVGFPRQPDFSTRVLGFFAKHFGSVFALALMQSAEQRTPYIDDVDASDHIAADERVHAEVVRALAQQSRERMSGPFRAAIFGVNDGLVSNLALVVGVMGSGVAANLILLTGISGLLAGALSMAAGEYVSVKSQVELLEASQPAAKPADLAAQLDMNANELALVYRARGLDPVAAEDKAQEVFAQLARAEEDTAALSSAQENDAPVDPAPGMSEAARAAAVSFCLFALGALIPIVPFLFGASALSGGIIAVVLVSMSLLITGGIVGVISGKPPASRALRQLAIGLGAAAITYGLGLAFGAVLS